MNDVLPSIGEKLDTEAAEVPIDERERASFAVLNLEFPREEVT